MDATDLEELATAGNVEAQFELARQHEAQGKHDLARGWFARAAKAGHIPALRCLAANLLIQDPINAEHGVSMARAAAEKNDAEAAYICSGIAAQDPALPNNLTVALEYLARAARLGSLTAQVELRLLANDGSVATAHDTLDWSHLAGRVDFAPWHQMPLVRTVFESPRIQTVAAFAPPSVCDWIVERARPGQDRAAVYDPITGRGRADEVRTNSSTSFGIDGFGIVLTLLRARIVALIGVDSALLEPPSILYYRPGERFGAHYDFINPDVPSYAAELQKYGQRVATFLVYLNEGYDAGETAFLDLDWRFKGKKGDGLLFWNVGPDGKPEMKTRHEGEAPTAGEKWVLSQWIRMPAGAKAIAPR